MLIGLTGGLGCGKSPVLKYFEDLGCPVFSSDAVVARLLKTAPIKSAIREQFSGAVFEADGKVSKKALAERAFSSEEDLRKLESILHPRVLEAIRFFGQVHANRVAVAEVPLLFEKNLESMFVKTVCVACSEETALKRYTLARSVFTAEARRRMDLQLPIEEKKKRADLVIDSEQHPDVVKRQVEVLYRRFCLMGRG